MPFTGTETQLKGLLLAEIQNAFPGGTPDVEKLAGALANALVKWVVVNGKGAVAITIPATGPIAGTGPTGPVTGVANVTGTGSIT